MHIYNTSIAGWRQADPSNSLQNTTSLAKMVRSRFNKRPLSQGDKAENKSKTSTSFFFQLLDAQICKHTSSW